MRVVRMKRTYTLKIKEEVEEFSCLSDALAKIYGTEADFTLTREST